MEEKRLYLVFFVDTLDDRYDIENGIILPLP